MNNIELDYKVIQEFNNNWNKHIGNYFNAVKYLKKNYIRRYVCHNCEQ